MFNDGNRVYPVNKLIMHHAVSDDMTNWTDLQVQDWFSNIGKARGYSNGAVNPYHEHPGRPGQYTYSMAHYCLRRYTLDGNKYGWRLTELIKNPFQAVAWHCGNWGANQTSIGIETAGNFLSQDIDDKALQLVADTLAKPWDEEIGGALSVYGHKDWFATACPGRIYDKINQLVDQINNGSAWTARLWPVAPPITPPAPVVSETKRENYDPVRKFVFNRDIQLAHLPSLGASDAKVYKKGEEIDIAQRLEFSNGVVAYRTKYSADKEIGKGFDGTALDEKKPPVVVPPVVEPPVVTPPVTPVDPPKDTKDDEQDQRLSAIEKILNAIVAFFKNLGGK